MSATLGRILQLVAQGEVRISEHGYDELAQDGILAEEVVAGVEEAQVIEDYPDYPKGPCVLVLQKGEKGEPVHAVWGIPRDRDSPAVLVTAYRPEARKWSSDFRNRRPR
jgi:hypothetical protein